MSQMSNLDVMLKELRQNAESILDLVSSIENSFSGDTANEETPKKEPKKKAAKETEQAEPVKEITLPEITLPEIKKVLMEKSKSGFDKEVHALIKSYGVDKLSAIDKSFYPELMQKAEVIGNA